MPHSAPKQINWLVFITEKQCVLCDVRTVKLRRQLKSIKSSRTTSHVNWLKNAYVSGTVLVSIVKSSMLPETSVIFKRLVAGEHFINDVKIEFSNIRVIADTSGSLADTLLARCHYVFWRSMAVHVDTGFLNTPSSLRKNWDGSQVPGSYNHLLNQSSRKLHAVEAPKFYFKITQLAVNQKMRNQRPLLYYTNSYMLAAWLALIILYILWRGA
jgi:hypothetical protein